MHSTFPHSAGKDHALAGKGVAFRSTAPACELPFCCGTDTLTADITSMRFERGLGFCGFCPCIARVVHAPMQTVSAWGASEFGILYSLRLCSCGHYQAGAHDSTGGVMTMPMTSSTGDEFMRAMATNKALIVDREVMIAMGNTSTYNDTRGLIRTFARPCACLSSAVVVQPNGLLSASTSKCYATALCAFTRVKLAAFIHDMPYVSAHTVGCCNTPVCCCNCCAPLAMLELPSPGGGTLFVPLAQEDATAVINLVQQRMTTGSEASLVAATRTIVSEDPPCCGTEGDIVLGPDIITLRKTNLRNCLTTMLTTCYGTESLTVMRTADVSSVEVAMGSRCAHPEPMPGFAPPRLNIPFIGPIVIIMYEAVVGCLVCNPCTPLIALVGFIWNLIRAVYRCVIPPYKLSMHGPSAHHDIEFRQNKPEHDVVKVSTDASTLVRMARERARVRMAHEWADALTGAQHIGVPITLGPREQEIIYAPMGSSTMQVPGGPGGMMAVMPAQMSMTPAYAAPQPVLSPLHIAKQAI